MAEALHIAVDLGAGSGRVFLVGLAPGEVRLEEARRCHFPPRHSAGHLRWDIHKIFGEIKAGLRRAAEMAGELGRPVASIGVDSWGVDYGLIDASGRLLEAPVCYRDERTQGVMERVFARVDREQIFERTGIQFLVFNTLFQLYAHNESGIAGAAQLLLIPDLINYFLTGKAATEYTNATTTQMVRAGAAEWDRELLDRLMLPSHLLAEIVPAGTRLGPLDPLIARAVRLEGAKVIATATHDTASAVIGAPLESGWAYISSGTWSLLGVERQEPLIDSDVARHNFTNEGGAFGTVRFLKNVMGLWILESCRKEWQARGLNLDYDDLLARVAACEPTPGLIFPDDPRFFNPPSMLEAIAGQMAETGQRAPDDPPSLARVILDSLALRYASVLRTIESLTGRRVSGVQVVGGGSRNDYLNQATADLTRLSVVAGPVESTVIGNALVQALAGGGFPSPSEARAHAAEHLPL